ncbi:hypothetical protein AC244_22605 [Ensifer adhaerens]|uniref:Uncharacterized protein n=1 Tax=Ensifer adhaerens TaxID=106592 RepID=A0A0L8BLV1_ENSAD|nr:hypothetical protein [Ensifer adhaerens]KOF15563.1 hypothetical protein AC244_22605 [Ensifer adhaerens]
MSISIIPDLKGPDEVPRSVVELTPIRREERFVSVLLDELQAAPLESRPSQPSFSYRYELLGAALRTG